MADIVCYRFGHQEAVESAPENAPETGILPPKGNSKQRFSKPYPRFSKPHARMQNSQEGEDADEATIQQVSMKIATYKST